MKKMLRIQSAGSVVALILQYTSEGKISGTSCDGSKEI